MTDPPTTPRRLLRVATYNVHSCVGRDGRRDPPRIERVIDELDADVVALQEFQYPADIAIGTSAPVVLEALDRYRFTFGPTLQRASESFGNVLLSRPPIRQVQRLDLSVDRCEPRGALCATLDVGGRDLVVLATHLGLRLGERRSQVRRILGHIGALGSTAYVVVGDFNDWLPGRSVVHALDAALGPVGRPRTFPARFPLLALDRIWVHPREALRRLARHSSPLAREASDHLPVVAEIDLDPPAS
jgi:endonuclease/exonuclease/phosphatase family metal-dependent hydrolase